MRWVVVAAVVLFAQDGGAGREVETWLGTWSGTATWKQCTAEGTADLEVAVRWHDGALWIDGAAIYDGLGEVVPEVRAGGALVHSADGLTVALKKGKKGQAVLTLETAADCRMTARLERAGTGIAACDDLLALATVAAACPLEVDDDPFDEVEAWSALDRAGTRKQKRAAASCARRADALRERLVAADCVPPDDDPADLAECRVVWRLAQELLRCGHVPVEFKQSTIESMAELRRSLRSLAGKDGGGEAAAAYCVESATLVRENLEILRCSP